MRAQVDAQELATISGHPNRRRAIQFERLRSWKQGILSVAHEEMLHLHYVQCMLRAVGARPSFALPVRNDAGVWTIPNWHARIGTRPVDGRDRDLDGTRLIPLAAR